MMMAVCMPKDTNLFASYPGISGFFLRNSRNSLSFRMTSMPARSRSSDLEHSPLVRFLQKTYEERSLYSSFGIFMLNCM